MKPNATEDLIFQADVETDKIFHIAEGEFTINRNTPYYQTGFGVPFYYGADPSFYDSDLFGYFEIYWRIKGTGAWQQGSRISGSATWGNGIGLWVSFTNAYSAAQLTAWVDTNVIKDTANRTVQWRCIFFDSNNNNGPVRVSTTTDTDVQWSSFYDYRKIHKKGSIPMTVSKTSQTKTVSHTLGYRPVVKAWFVNEFSPFPGAPETIRTVYMARDVFVDTIVYNDRVEFTTLTGIPDLDNGATFTGTLEYRIYHNE